jgi:hypothetical protein
MSSVAVNLTCETDMEGGCSQGAVFVKIYDFGIDIMKALMSTVSLQMQMHSASMNDTYPCIQSVILTG